MNKIIIEKTINNNNFLSNIVDTASQAFTKEVLLFLFVGLFILIREKTKSILKIKKIKKQYFDENSKTDQIRVVLINILKLVQCDRVLLLQFHNGDSFFGNLDQLKVSMTHQITQVEITKIDNIISLPISILHRELETLKKNSERFEWINKAEAYPLCQKYLDKIGVELYGSKLLINKFGIPLGILGLHFCSNEYIYLLLNETKLKALDSLAKEVEALL